jgi:hypothetical protein
LRTYVIKEQLPAEAANFKKISVVGFSASLSWEEFLKRFLEDSKTGYKGVSQYNTSGYNSIVNLDKNKYMVFLFDNDEKLLAYFKATPKRIAAKPDYPPDQAVQQQPAGQVTVAPPTGLGTVARENVNLDYTNDVVLKIGADPARGFYWDYYLFVPRTVKANPKIHLLVETNNTGTVSDDIQVHDQAAKILIERGAPNTIARNLDVPLLVPVFPRPLAFGNTYTHALDRDTLLVKDGNLKRIDLQLIAMIRDAREILTKQGLPMEEKVFMHGFSASGNFLTRFPMMHPQVVKAFAAGGINSIPTFPVSQWKGQNLRYPVGIADLKEITGIEFNMAEYKQVAQYMYMGYLDKNDTTLFRDAYELEDANLIRSLIGEDMMLRWQVSQDIFKELGIPAQFVTYNGTSHKIRTEMIDDIIKFFKTNTGAGVVQITPHLYPYVAYRLLEQVTITGAYWSGTPQLPRHISIPPNSFVIMTKEWLTGQDHQQLVTFLNNLPSESRTLTLKAQGYPDVQAKLTGSTFSSNPQGFVVSFSSQELQKIVPGVNYTIHTIKKSDTYYLTVESGLPMGRGT